MAASLGRSPLRAYVAMASIALAVFVGLNLVWEPLPRSDEPPGVDAVLPLVTVAPAPSLERDFLTTVLGRPRLVDAHPYCDGGRCCPTWRTTFGTTAPANDVIAAFEAEGFVVQPGDREFVRGGPFPPARWTGEFTYGGRWDWRRAEVARGPDVDRPAWPTVFSQSSAACES